jgi:hypothetical protein
VAAGTASPNASAHNSAALANFFFGKRKTYFAFPWFATAATAAAIAAWSPR